MAKIYAKLAPYKNPQKLQNIVIYCSNPRGQRQTDFHVHAKDWDEDMHCVLDSHPNWKNINSVIRVKVGEWENERLTSTLTGVEFDPLKKSKAKVPETKTFTQFCAEYIAGKSPSGPLTVADSTKEKYEIEWRKLAAFDETTLLSHLDADWTNRYKSHLETTYPGTSTLHNSFKFIKKMLKEAKRYLKHDPLQDVKLPSKPDSDEIRYLDPEEVTRLEQFCFSPSGKPFYRCALWQLYGSYSGLRHSDWALHSLRRYLEAGRIELKQTKTRGNVIIPIYPKLKMVIERLIDYGKPPYTIQAHNQCCKAMAPAAKVNEDLTSHFGRHSFGVYLADNDVPPQVAQKLMGHKNIRETMIYYEVTPRKVADTVAKLLG